MPRVACIIAVRMHITANGEFYDFERIHSRLEQHGHAFRTRSDSEIALHLYEEVGAQCVHDPMLMWMTSICLLDEGLGLGG